jgi:tripartite-type tricarboxylate transporter receptor subunit TctC
MTRIAASLAVALFVLAGVAAHAQPYPSKPIKFLVPFAAGGPADTMARLTAQVLSEGIGQSIVIDNRPGAGGIIGARAAAAADPDGYTLMYGNTASLVVGPAVYANPGYDPVKHFAPIALVAVSYNVLVLNPTFPANSVQ